MPLNKKKETRKEQTQIYIYTSLSLQLRLCSIFDKLSNSTNF